MTRARRRRAGPLARAGFVLGVALGGFFDGILLHQVLQWHHLLSLVPGEDLRRIETQILADGAFHVLMWLIAVGGLWLLWRARGELAQDRSGRRLLVATLVGFAFWNALDVVGFHWVLHIHRIRVDVPVGDRLRWDLLWLGLFALLPALAALAVARRRATGGGSGPTGAAALALLVVAAAGLSLRSPPDVSARPVLFRAGTAPSDILAAASAVNGTVISITGERLAVLDLPEGAGWRLYGHGALVVGGPGSPAACLSWTAT